MNVKDYQQAMPPGIKLERELPAGDSIGKLFEACDVRLGEDFRVKRLVRFLPAEDGVLHEEGRADWRAPLRERVNTLVSLRLPYVSCPREFNLQNEGDPFIVSDDHGDPLATLLHTIGGVSVGPDEAQRWLTEILIALAGLHARGLPHGDVRPSNIVIDRSKAAKRSTAWLVEAAVGPMAWWSKGEVRPPVDVTRYYPPEWKGKMESPNTQADLYALGIIGCEMFLGRSAIQNALHGGTSLWTTVVRKLKLAGVSSPMRRLLKTLLEPNPKQRPADASTALEQLHAFEQASAGRPWQAGALAMGCAGLLMTLLAWQFRSDSSIQVQQNAELQQEIDRLTQDREGISAGFDMARTRVGELEVQLTTARSAIQELTDRSATEATESVNPDQESVNPDHEVAQSLWKENVPPDDQFRLQLNQTISVFEDAAAPVKREGYGWHRELRALYVESQSWFKADPQMKRLYAEAANEPWQADRIAAAKNRMRSLVEAEQVWRKWAESQMSWDNLQALLDDSRRPQAVNDILTGWRNDILQLSHSTWTLRLTAGSAPKGYGTTRQAGVSGDGSWVYSETHDWALPEKHQYPPSHRRSEIPFHWQPGNPTAVCLYGERTTWKGGARRLLIDNATFDGPLAIWRMHDLGRARSGLFVLEFEIVNCPGPPRRSRTLPRL